MPRFFSLTNPSPRERTLEGVTGVLLESLVSFLRNPRRDSGSRFYSPLSLVWGSPLGWRTLQSPTSGSPSSTRPSFSFPHDFGPSGRSPTLAWRWTLTKSPSPVCGLDGSLSGLVSLPSKPLQSTRPWRVETRRSLATLPGSEVGWGGTQSPETEAGRYG